MTLDDLGLRDPTLYQLLGHLSFMLTALSYGLRDMLLLRVVAVLAGLCTITFAANAPGGVSWIPVVWQVVLVSINLLWSAVLLRERSGIRFSEEERELYGTIFRAFTPVEFMKLMRLARWEQAAPGDLLAEAGRQLDSVLLIYNGGAEVRGAGEVSVELRDGAFVGEMSFIRGGAASADVRCTTDARIVRWPREQLSALLRRNPAMQATLQTVFSEDLTRKLLGRSYSPPSEGRNA